MTKICTASYRAFIPEEGVLPVQTSNGRPKYPLHFPLEAKMPALYPDWNDVRRYKSLGPDGFERRYFAKLDAIGTAEIQRGFDELAKVTNSHTLVLLCFEKSRLDCHRGSFAKWWELRTGEEVEELR